MIVADFRAVVVVLATFSTACASQKPESSQASVTPESASVPIEAPDTIPGWFYHDSNYAAGRPRYLKHIIGVAFRDGTSQTARQAAIDSVGGTVVGGWRFAPAAEGLYAVQVNDSSSADRLREFRLKLRSLPQVKAAIRILATTVSSSTPGLTAADSAIIKTDQ